MTDIEDKIRGGLYGVLVADALGVSFEFKYGAAIPQPIDMVMPSSFRKTFPSVKYGTWSDDGSLTLALADSIASVHGVDEEDFGRRVQSWYLRSDYTPDRKTYDVGNTTQEAILRMMRGHAARVAGLTDMGSNGNGSLMRTLPLALYHQGTDAELYDAAGRLSAVTHGHDVSRAACGAYCIAARHMVNGMPSTKAFIEGLRNIHTKLDIPPEPKGSGYVLDSLSYAIKAARSGYSYEQVVLEAIRLGGDTDTTAAIAGGLIGARDGMSAIPTKWLSKMRGMELAGEIIERFIVDRCSSRS